MAYIQISDFDLADTLYHIHRSDERGDYETRQWLIYQALHIADQLDYAVGFRIDPAEPEWPVAYIQLPTGQVSWHMPCFPSEWDGHTTDQKYKRIHEYGKAYFED